MRKFIISILIVLIAVSAFSLLSASENTESGILSDYDIRNSMQTSDDGYIFTGMIFSDKTLDDILLIKTDSQESIVFKKSFHRATEDEEPPVISDEYGLYVFQTEDGGYIIIGMSNVFQEGEVPYVIKTDKDGNKMWDRGIIGSEEILIKAAQEDDGFLVLSYNYIVASYRLFKFDTEFNEEWRK